MGRADSWRGGGCATSPPCLPQFPHLHQTWLGGPVSPQVPGLGCTAFPGAAGRGTVGRGGTTFLLLPAPHLTPGTLPPQPHLWRPPTRHPRLTCDTSPCPPISPAAPSHPALTCGTSPASPHLTCGALPHLAPCLTCSDPPPPPHPTPPHLRRPSPRGGARWHAGNRERCSPTTQASRPTRSPWRRPTGSRRGQAAEHAQPRGGRCACAGRGGASQRAWAAARGLFRAAGGGVPGGHVCLSPESRMREEDPCGRESEQTLGGARSTPPSGLQDPRTLPGS